MKKQIKIMLVIATILSLAACKKDGSGLFSPARDINGIWRGNLTCSNNDAAQTNQTTGVMVLDLKQNGNNITGTMYFGYNSGSLTGTISGASLQFSTNIGNGCINVHGTFTSSNMEGMKNSSPPPYLTCGDVLNNGHGSKGIEFHLVKI